jgi:hypothetical protein
MWKKIIIKRNVVYFVLVEGIHILKRPEAIDPMLKTMDVELTDGRTLAVT